MLGPVLDEVELIGGAERRAIVIAAPDPGWPHRFREAARVIRTSLGATALRVDHVGSTAVPGLAAKPIIDVQLSVSDVADEPAYLPRLEAAGYRLRVRERDHRMLRTAALDLHLHVCGEGSPWERRHLLFRDWLRRDGLDRRRYQECKQSLAARPWPTLQAYADAKGATIAAIMVRAEAWARSSAWTP